MSLSRRTFLALSAASVAASLNGGCTTPNVRTMKPSNSVVSLNEFLALRGLNPSELSIPQLVEGTLSFYQSVRASGLAKDPQADMLLFQWGVFDWGQGERFEFDITRQFISAGAFGDDAISQLNCTAYFAPTPELRAIPAANHWCRSISDIESFSTFIHSSAAYHAVSSSKPLLVSLRWEKV